MTYSKKQNPLNQTKNTQPGIEADMHPLPEYIKKAYSGSNKLKNKVAIVSGGDSGIGRAVSLHFAIEGAKVAIIYLNEHEDANETKRLIEEKNGECLLISGDISEPLFCNLAVGKTIKYFNTLDILVNNAGEQHPTDNFLNISQKQLENTFKTNVYGTFFLTQAALKHMSTGASIINTSSITSYEGSNDLIDYSATKGAITSLTRSLSENLISKGIRVNSVAPGPIWTPLIPSTFSKNKLEHFGKNTPMKRAGQPAELAPAYVYLASDDSSYVSGQTIHVNGGIIVSS